MRQLIKGAVALVALSILVSGASAQKPKAKTMVCPFCHMKMGTTKTKATPVAVKLKSGTFYCCTACGKKKK